jgi:hypothetical protein
MRMVDRGLSYEHGRSGDQVEACRCLNTAARLMSVFQDGLLTLQRLRTGGNQTLTVQHVNVAPGGQAVIGNVQAGGTKRGGVGRKMGNAVQLAIHRAPKCGAHARTTGNPCRSPAMPNGRCRMHGGRAGRKPTHGGTRRLRLQTGGDLAKCCACELIDGA